MGSQQAPAGAQHAAVELAGAAVFGCAAQPFASQQLGSSSQQCGVQQSIAFGRGPATEAFVVPAGSALQAVQRIKNGA